MGCAFDTSSHAIMVTAAIRENIRSCIAEEMVERTIGAADFVMEAFVVDKDSPSCVEEFEASKENKCNCILG